jgi:CO/xanthine dehydrogenase Mo-binding subunit
MTETKEYKWVGKRPIRPDGVDKVTGRARFGADFSSAGQLVGKVLRSPHAHAVIKSIDISKAVALGGVKSLITSADLQDQPNEMAAAGEAMVNYRDMTRNVMAREKVLYEGHAVAAVAATSSLIADAALALIEVTYEVLPHVIDAEEAMAAGAPILHDHIRTEGVEPAPTTASNVAKRVEFTAGDSAKGLAEADFVVERRYTTQPVHQGYIEPHSVTATYSADGHSQVWTSTQGHFMVRGFTARLLGMDVAQIRVTPSEIGGGFGGKTVVYLEPLALLMSKKSGRPVKMAMTREEVFRASGPTSGGTIDVKIGAKKDGTMTGAEVTIMMQAGAFPGSPVGPAAMCALTPYVLEHAHVVGYDVVSNRPKVAAYRAPGAPISEYAVECAVDELATKLGMDPIELRLKNAAQKGTKTLYGPTLREVGYIECLEAAKNSDQYKSKLGPNQGRGIAAGFWFNIGGESSASIHVGEDGTVVLTSPNPDIGGSRASLSMMAAEELGIHYEKVRPIIGDTSSVGWSFLTGGSRVTFAVGMAVVEAARDIVTQLRGRAAKTWDVDVEGVVWKDGAAYPASSNVGDFDPLTLADLAGNMPKTGGPISGRGALNAQGAGPGFGVHVCDVEVDPDTGRVTVLRYLAIQDVGKAIHPSYVEGQLQGGAAQGIGWALNEEYVYGDRGQLENPGFLDYRIPVASDLPMIDTILVEVPNDRHPYGARGVGETPIIPPLGAVANAVAAAAGTRVTDLPISPPKLLEALSVAKAAE